nr:MAG TPA: DNA polymerase [Caudoviricetes sp.]
MKILTNSVDKLPVLVTVLLKRARSVSGLPADTLIEVVDDPQAEDIRITLGTVRGYKGDAYKTLSPKQIVNNPQSVLFLAQALQYGYLGPIDPGLELGKDWVIWEGQDISFKKGSVIALDIESAGDIDNDTFAAGRILSIALWNGKFGVVIPEELAETPESAELIERLCRDCIVICHNGTFDMPYLSKRLGINVYHHEDTLLMHFVLDNLAGEHGLKPLARRWLRAADWDSDAKSYLKHGAYFENIPRDKLYRYNCIAEGSPVLTDRGLVPIEDVQLTDKVWDGVEWVQHEGVVYKGTQPVVVLDKLVVTPEHLILTTEGDYVCARSIQAGIRRPAIGGNGALPQTVSAINREDEARASAYSSGSPLHTRTGETEKLRRSWSGNAIQVDGQLHLLGANQPADGGLQRSTVRHTGTLRTWEPAPSVDQKERNEQTEQRVCGVHGAECPTGPLVGPSENRQPGLSTNEMGANTQTTKWDVSAGGDSKATPSTTRVYDILNAGPRHRFTVSGIVVSNCYDAYWTYELYKYFKQMVDKAPDFYKHRMRVTRVLHDVQMNGVAVSFTALDELEEKYKRQCDEHLVILKKLAGDDFNPQSPKQIAEYFASKGVSSPSFDAKHLKKLKRAGKEPEFIDALLAYRYAAKLIGNFIANVRRKRGEDKRIHPYYLPHGAKTGRLSAKGPAIQTMGRDSGIKRALVAAPGCKIISCDYSQAELRTVAELADDEAMIAAFQPGAPDFFDDLMTKIWPDDYPTIEAYKEFKHEHPKTAKNKRALVKSVVYGCVPLNYPILTAEGWKSVDDLVEGELVYAADTATGQLVQTPLRKINRYSNAPVNTYSTRGFNVTTTANHKWVVASRKKRKWDEINLVEAQDIKHDDKIMLAYPYLSNHDDGYTDEEVQLISWVVSDGYLHCSKTNQEIRGILMHIMQAKPQYVEEIKKLMTNFSHSVNTRPGVNYETAYTWRIHAGDARRVWDKSGIGDEKENLCQWVLSLNAKHLEMFVDIFNKAEGHFSNGTWVVTQKHGYTADAYRLAASLCGKYVTSSEYKEGGISKYCLRKKSFVTAQKLVAKDAGSCDVWCPTTDYGTWVTQDENGSIIVTGNSNYGRGIRAIAAELEKSYEEAEYVVNQYLGAYSGLRDWQQKVRYSVGRKEENYMRRTKFGMTYNPLFVPDADYASTQNEALAFVPQSTANDICLNAAIKINEQVGQYGAKLIGLVHDATYVECPEETVEECSRMMEREMSKAAALIFNRVPFVAEAEVGNNWEEV